MLLKDKVCIVAGAGSTRGIGYATAELFAEHGAKVVVVDISIDEDSAAAIAASIRKNTRPDAEILGLRCDITSAADCDRMVATVVARFGTLDCLVNSAGIVRSQPLLDITEQQLADPMVAKLLQRIAPTRSCQPPIHQRHPIPNATRAPPDWRR